VGLRRGAFLSFFATDVGACVAGAVSAQFDDQISASSVGHFSGVELDRKIERLTWVRRLRCSKIRACRSVLHARIKGKAMQNTISRRAFVTGLGMLSMPLIALAQEREKKERDDKSQEEKKKEAEEKKEEAKDKAEDADVKDRVEDAVDDKDKVVDGPGTDRSQDRRQDRRRDAVK